MYEAPAMEVVEMEVSAPLLEGSHETNADGIYEED